MVVGIRWEEGYRDVLRRELVRGAHLDVSERETRPGEAHMEEEGQLPQL